MGHFPFLLQKLKFQWGIFSKFNIAISVVNGAFFCVVHADGPWPHTILITAPPFGNRPNLGITPWRLAKSLHPPPPKRKKYKFQFKLKRTFVYLLPNGNTIFIWIWAKMDAPILILSQSGCPPPTPSTPPLSISSNNQLVTCLLNYHHKLLTK